MCEGLLYATQRIVDDGGVQSVDQVAQSLEAVRVQRKPKQFESHG